MRAALFAVPALLALFAAPQAVGQTALNRCVGDDGVPIYTDRACADLGARERGAPIEPDENRLPEQALGCARDTDTLLARVRMAIEREDHNALAGAYHWAGASGYTARAVMPSLQAVAQRRLRESGVETVRTGVEDTPSAVWLDQDDPQRPGETLRHRFTLIQHAGCWWLQL